MHVPCRTIQLCLQTQNDLPMMEQPMQVACAGVECACRWGVRVGHAGRAKVRVQRALAGGACKVCKHVALTDGTCKGQQQSQLFGHAWQHTRRCSRERRQHSKRKPPHFAEGKEESQCLETQRHTPALDKQHVSSCGRSRTWGQCTPDAVLTCTQRKGGVPKGNLACEHIVRFVEPLSFGEQESTCQQAASST